MAGGTSLINKTWDDERLRIERLAHLQDTMRKNNVGGLLLKDWVSSRYAINTRIPSGLTFVPVEGRCVCFVRPMDDGYVSMIGVETRPVSYESVQAASDPDGGSKLGRWAQSIRALMDEFGVGGEMLGIDEMEPLSTIALDRAGVQMTNGREILQQAAAVKTQDEVAIYWEMGKVHSALMQYFWDELKPGVTETEMCSRIYSKAIELGVEDLLQINVCAGENTWPWRRWPTQRAFHDGEFVGMDLHTHGPGGYVFDAARTYLCGSHATDRQKELFQRAHEYNNACIDLMKPGLAIPDWVESLPRVPERFEEAVYTFHILHSNGLNPGGYPNVVKQRRPVDDILQENQVLSLDCYFAEEGDKEAAKLEELVLITRDGAVKMSDMPYDSHLL